MFYILYIAKYPTYDPKDTRPVLVIYDIGNFLLAMAKDVTEALKFISEHQIVNSAIKLKLWYFYQKYSATYLS